MAEIRWTEEAQAWLKDIHDYIAIESPSAADAVASGIYDKVQVLRRFPEIGHIFRSEPEGYVRILLYGHYRIAYLFANNTVDVLGIFHGALDIDRYFR